MRNLFAFVWKNHFYFLFILLEIFAFALIINSNVYQQWVFVNSSHKLTGSVYQTVSDLREYFSLRKNNELLTVENARLRETLGQIEHYFDTAGFNKREIPSQPDFRYIPAKVISNTVTLRNNYIMLDRGRLNGIEKDMAVICPEGIVGIVINVSNHYSWVMSVLNENSKVNGKLLKNNFQGSLTWEGGDYRRGTLRDIPAHIELTESDTIVTSGYSLMFPEGVMIGTIDKYFIDRGDHFHTIKVLFSVDYNNLRHVYVVKNLRRTEQLSVRQYL